MKDFIIEEGGYYKHLDMLFLYERRDVETGEHFGRLLLTPQLPYQNDPVWRHWCITDDIEKHLFPLTLEEKRRWGQYMQDGPPP